MSNWTQGTFLPNHPNKILGENKQFIFKSSLEQKTMYWLDNNKNVLKYDYENIKIPYFFDNKWRNYIIDFYAVLIDRDGKEIKVILEVKPYKQTIPPIKPKNKNKKREIRYKNELYEYSKNQNKWKYAKQFCEKNNLKFIVLTDKEINKF